MPIPTTAPAVVAEATGGPEVLEFRVDHPIPNLKDGQILVQNAISGVNYVDTYFRNGLYPSVMPTVLGREGAGTIVAVGANVDETKLTVGDRVVWLGDAGYAQYTAVNAAKAMRLPDQVSFEDATASCLSGLTALALVEESYKVMKGDRVLLLAAAGSVGTLMTMILKLRGAEVIALVGSPEKAAVAKRLGADHVIDYRTPEGDDWPKVVRQLTDGKGVDVVYDSVGKDTWQKSIEAVRRKGTIIWFGNASGPVPPLTLHCLASKCIKIARPTLFGYIETREEFEHYCNELFQLLISGQLKAEIYRIYPLADVQLAHQANKQDVESRKTTGKLLLRP